MMASVVTSNNRWISWYSTMTDRMILRPMEPADTSFFFNSWLESWKKSRYAGVIRNCDYYKVTREVIEGLIKRGARIHVACNPSNQEHIYGWVCHELTGDGFAVVHYLYVKDPFLKMDVDKALMSMVDGEKPGFYTFNYTQVSKACPNWKWAPEIARRK